MGSEGEFGFEVLKLLVQVALADHRLELAEENTILELSRSWGVSDSVFDSVRQTLRSGRSLGAPNLGLLRARRADVIRAAEQLCEADGEVSFDESAIIAQIEELLGAPLE